MGLFQSLSGRLLALTVAFVMLAEICLFVPSVAFYRLGYLQERLEKAQLASLALLAAPERRITPELERALLEDAEVYAVSRRRNNSRELLMRRAFEGPIKRRYDVREDNVLRLVYDALICATTQRERYILVVGPSMRVPGETIEIVVDDWRVKDAMLSYAINIFWLSLAISAMTAGLIYLTAHRVLVRPMSRLIDGVVSFREAPDDPANVYAPSGAAGEIGAAERELAQTQTEVQSALKQRARLAALGEALAKVSHDLRNMLASTQLLADRLENSRDPVTARVAPKLIGSVDRAIRLCERTLRDGRADEPAPQIETLALAVIVDEVGATLGTERGAASAVRFENRVSPTLHVPADPDQLFRALLNLARNSAQAIQASERGGVVAVEAGASREGWRIDVVDDGPGLPEAAKASLFTPFRGSTSRGGSGLGLAIARELARNQGGDLVLAQSSAEGARFRLMLPHREDALQRGAG